MFLKVFVFERLLHKIFFSHSPSVQAGGKIVPFMGVGVWGLTNKQTNKQLVAH